MNSNQKLILTSENDLNLVINSQKIYHIKFWLTSCRNQYLKALRLIDFHNYEELRKDWFALQDLTEEKFPTELMGEYYEILFTRYTNEISKYDLVTQGDLFDPFYQLKVWGEYFTEKLMPEFLKYDDDIRCILKLVGAIADENKTETSRELIKSLNKLYMPVL